MPAHRTLEESLDHLVRLAVSEPEELQVWTIAALASKLGLGVVVTPGGAGCSIESINEVGMVFADQIIERLADEPDRQAETLRAAWQVVDRLVAEVRQRGLTAGRRQ